METETYIVTGAAGANLRQQPSTTYPDAAPAGYLGQGENVEVISDWAATNTVGSETEYLPVLVDGEVLYCAAALLTAKDKVTGMENRYGIDVCSYQGVIDWVKVKAAGCDFAVLKCIRKDLSADTQFAANVAGCNKQGIPFDVYTYVYESTVSGAKARAAAAVKALQAQGVSNACVWWDLEDSSISTGGNSAKKAALNESILAAQAVIEAAGYRFGIYCNTNWYTSILDVSGLSCPFWMARWDTNPVTVFGIAPTKSEPAIVHELCGWQYCSKGQINGISGYVDLDIAYCHMGEGEASTSAETTTPNAASTAKEVYTYTMNTLKNGSKGLQVWVLQSLLIRLGYDLGSYGADGDFGSKTEAAVKAYQTEHGLAVDGIVGPKAWAELLAG